MEIGFHFISTLIELILRNHAIN